MSKRIVAAILAFCFVMASFGLALALDGKGNFRKGKYLFRKNCRACHAPGKSAKELSPISLTQAQWKAAFTKNTFPCKAKWPKLSDKDLNDIYTYMYKHAKDSPTPAKCK